MRLSGVASHTRVTSKRAKRRTGHSCLTGHNGQALEAGFDEVVWVNLPRLPENIRSFSRFFGSLVEPPTDGRLVIFVVAAFSGGSLRDVLWPTSQNHQLSAACLSKAQNGMLHVLEEDLQREVQCFAVHPQLQSAIPYMYIPLYRGCGAYL